jgi:putative PIN family toxin of toxin-antitoxin system
VLAAVRRHAVEPIASWALAEELADVLRRPEIQRYGVAEHDVRALFVLISPAVPDVEIDVAVRDPDDVAVVSAAVAGRAEAIATGDRDLLENPQLRAWLRERGISVHSPRSLLEVLG